MKFIIIPGNIYKRFECRQTYSCSDLYTKNWHPLLKKSLFTGKIKSYEYSDKIIPLLASNVRFKIVNSEEQAFSITGISSYKDIILCGSTNGAINMYNLRSMDNIRQLNAGKGPTVKFPLGYVLTRKEKERVSKGKKFTLNPICTIDPGIKKCHRGVISSIELSPLDGQLFVTTGWDGNVKVWDTIESTCVLDTKSNLKIYFSSIQPILTSIIGTALQDGSVRILDLRSGGQYTHSLHIDSKTTRLPDSNVKSPIYYISWKPDSEYILATTSQDGYIRLWDMRFTQQPYLYCNQNLPDWDYIQQTGYMTPLLMKNQMDSFGELKNQLNLNNMQEYILNYNNTNFSKMTNLTKAEEEFLYNKKKLNKESYENNSNKSLYLKNKLKQIQYDVTEYDNCSVFGINSPSTFGRGHECGITCCSFIYNGRYLISSDQDGTIKLWNTQNGKNCYVPFDRFDLNSSWSNYNNIGENYNNNKLLRYFRRFSIEDITNQNLFHPNGNDIGIWNIRTGKCIERLSAHISAMCVTVIHWSPYKQRIFSGGQDGKIMLWTI
ncbi:hypothetical protein ACR3K2_11280 [Cryptosporidium serpentis]